MNYRDTNLTIITGNLGDKPHYTLTSEKKDFATFSLAVNKHWKEEGKDYSRVDWFNIILNGHLAKFAANHLSKGSKVFIRGELRINKWVDDKGKRHSTVQILVQELQLLDKTNLKEADADKSEAAQ